jgi:hypothetical protein
VSKRVYSFVGIGCGIVLLLAVAAVIALLAFAPKVIQWSKNQFALEQTRQQWASDWQPPADSVDQFFPAKIDVFELETRDQNSEIPEIRFDVEGDHAVYRSGEDKIEVFVFQANDLEKEALFGRVHETYEDSQGGFKRITDVGYRLYYSSSQHGQNHLWWSKGVLLVFKTDSESDQEHFIETYFQATTVPE